MNKTIVLLTALAAIASAFTGGMLGRNWTKFPPLPAAEIPAQAAPAEKAPAPPAPQTPIPSVPRVVAPAPIVRSQPVPSPRQAPTAPVASPKAPAVPVTEPLARQALAKVGSDPAAERVWTQAINDASLPAKDRKNLIEDLNEVGLDPQNLTAADLPLIEYRITLLENIAPNAIDDTNAAAFDEAYKDLTTMRDQLLAEN